MERVEKVWGWEEVIVNQPLYCLKRLHLKGGFQSSLHYHRIKTETFVLEKGNCFLDLGEERINLMPGMAIHIEPGVEHRFGGWLVGATILEIATHHDDADVVRLAPSSELYEPDHEDIPAT